MPGWKSSKLETRKKAYSKMSPKNVRKITAPSVLLEIYEYGNEPCKIAALEQMAPSELIRLAGKTYWAQRGGSLANQLCCCVDKIFQLKGSGFLVERMNDDSLIIELLIKYPDRYHALSDSKNESKMYYIGEKMLDLLFSKLDQRTIDETALRSKSLRFIQRAKSQEVLSSLASDGDRKVRKEALSNKNADQQVVEKAALHDSDDFVREWATANLTNQSTLATVALHDKDSRVRETAVRKLTEQAVLSEAALHDKERRVREAAIEKLTEQAVLLEVALHDADHRLREAALEKLTDQNLISRIALNNSEEWAARSTRKEAVKKIVNKNLLKEIIKTDQGIEIRLAAFRRWLDLQPVSVQEIADAIKILIPEIKGDISNANELYSAIPEDKRKLLGFKYYESESEMEDQYGRYMDRHYSLSYKGDVLYSI